MLTVTAPAALDATGRNGEFIDVGEVDLLVSGGRVLSRTTTSALHADITVLKPDGSVLLVYRHAYLDPAVCRVGYDVLKRVRFTGRNRGAAGGRDPLTGDLRVPARKLDGALSRTTYGAPQQSAVIGAYDRTSRLPFCRLTAFNLDHAAEFERARPLVCAVDRAFAEALPDRHAAQQAAVARTPPEFIIRGTTFSTMTVNRNWRTALHRDKGDLAEGFGVMTVLEAGRYDGGWLVFPRYRVGVDMRQGGVCLADVHEYHGNTPIVGMPGRYVRLSTVYYFRAGMTACLSPREELARAQRGE